MYEEDGISVKEKILKNHQEVLAILYNGLNKSNCVSRMLMTQDERWLLKYNDVVEFIQTNYRNPSRHRIEEHDMPNWIKSNRKKMNTGELKPERTEMYKQLLELGEQYRYKNQYQ